MVKTLIRAIVTVGLVAGCGGDGTTVNPGGAERPADPTPEPAPVPTPIPTWPEGFSLPLPAPAQDLRLASTGAEIALAWQEGGSVSLTRVRPAAGSGVEAVSEPTIGTTTECETLDEAGTPLPGEPRYVEPSITVADGRFTLAFTLSWPPYLAGKLLRLPDGLDRKPDCSETLWATAAIGQCRTQRSGPAGVAAVGDSLALPYVVTQGCAGQPLLEFGSGITLPPEGDASNWPGIPDLPPPDPTSSLDRLQASNMAIGGDGTSALAIGVSPDMYPGILVTENDATLVDLSELAPEPLDPGAAPSPGTDPNAIAITTLGDDFLVVWSDGLDRAGNGATQILAARVDQQGRPLDVRPDLRVRRLGWGASRHEVNLQAASLGDIALVTWTTEGTSTTDSPRATGVFVAGEISSQPLSLDALFAPAPDAPTTKAVSITAHEEGFALASLQTDIEVRILSPDELPAIAEFPPTPTCRVPEFESCETSADCCGDMLCDITPSGFGPYCF